MGSDVERYHIPHNFQFGGIYGVPTLALNCYGGGCGIRRILYGDPEDVILFYMHDSLITSACPYWIQWDVDVLAGRVDWVGMWENYGKKVGVV